MDPYERAMEEGGESLKLWLLVPVQQKIKQFFKDYDAFPHQGQLTQSRWNWGR